MTLNSNFALNTVFRVDSVSVDALVLRSSGFAAEVASNESAVVEKASFSLSMAISSV